MPPPRSTPTTIWASSPTYLCRRSPTTCPPRPPIGQSVRPTWHYTYNQYGQQLTQTDPYGHTTSFTYHPLTGQRTSRTLPAVNGSTVSESWLYDDLGRLDVHTDFNGQQTKYLYDAWAGCGRKQRYETDHVIGTDAPDQTTEYHYDAHGQPRPGRDP